MTLIELTVVIVVLLSLVGVLFIGVRAWKNGADRANCILNIRYVQLAVRGYSNTNGLTAGDNTMSLEDPFPLEPEIFGPDAMMDFHPECPSDGAYTYGGNVVPLIGALYMTCSLAADERHEPDEYIAW